MIPRTRAALFTPLALALTICPPAAAAPGVSLDRRTAVQTALAQHPQIAAARAEEAAVQAQLRQADAARRPMVSVLGGVGPSLKATLINENGVRSAEDQYSGLSSRDLSAVFLADLNVIQPLYTFGKIAHRREAAQHGLRARQAQTRMEKADVALEVARIYEGYLLARDADRFFSETAHWLKSTLDATEAKVARNAPGLGERDVLRLQTAISLATMGQHQASAGMSQAQGGLVAYLGLPRGSTIAVAEDELLPIGDLSEGLPDLVALAERHRPELSALREGRLALSSLSRAEAAGLAPDLFLLGFLQLAYTPGRDWLQTRYVVDPLNHFVPGALLGLRWQMQGSMAGARAEEQRQRSEVLASLGRWADAGIPAEVRQAYEDVRRARKDLDESGGAVVRAKRWMVQASADQAIGLLPLREVSDAVEAYATLRLAQLQARFAHNVGLAALSRACGLLDGQTSRLYLSSPSAGKESTP